MSYKGDIVSRPERKNEFRIVYGSNSAVRGWRDLCATSRNMMVECWEFLTATPLTETIHNYPLRGDLSTIIRDGKEHQRWQYKPSLKGTSRIWFYVEDKTVYLEQVHTHHPNQTK